MGGPIRVEKYRADFRDGLPGSFFQRARHCEVCRFFFLWQSWQLTGNRSGEQVGEQTERVSSEAVRKRENMASGIAGKDLPLHMRSEVEMGRPRDVDLRCSALVVYTDGEQLGGSPPVGPLGGSSRSGHAHFRARTSWNKSKLWTIGQPHHWRVD